MIVKKKSLLTGKENSMEIEIEEQDYKDFLNGDSLELCASYLCTADKKFILTGVTEEEEIYE